MRRYFIFFIVFVIFAGCKSIEVTDKETTGNILFKNLLKQSEEIKTVYVTGFMKIFGVKDVPSASIKFESYGVFESKKADFSVSFINTPLFDIQIDNNRITLINHTQKQFIIFTIEEVNFSKLVGINFNPISLSYFLLGVIPYTNDMKMMDFDIKSDEYYLEITNKNSKYTVRLDKDQNITYAKEESQFFDTIIIDNIKYRENDEGEKKPKYISFSSENGKRGIDFIISSISSNKETRQMIDMSVLNDYTEVNDIEEINISIK